MAKARSLRPVKTRQQAGKRPFNVRPINDLLEPVTRDLPRVAYTDDGRYVPGRDEIKHRINQSSSPKRSFRLAAPHTSALASREDDDSNVIHLETKPLMRDDQTLGRSIVRSRSRSRPSRIE